MPPTLEKLKGQLLSACRSVCACVRYKIYKDIHVVLKFHIRIPHQKIIDTYFWIIPLCAVMPLLKGHDEIM